MKYAVVDGKKTEAARGVVGTCPSCGADLFAKCGEVRVKHWAHKGNRMCDPWWENETEWHRDWKGRFPVDWQEVVHFDEKGEKHIADVKTSEDWVLEFQHSFLKPEERRAREAFYGKLIWIVDGLRRKRDKPQFVRLVNQGKVLNNKPLIVRLHFPEECTIVKERLDSSAFTFLDFHEEDQAARSLLWFLGPKGANREYHVQLVSAPELIKLHNEGNFGPRFTEYMTVVRKGLDMRSRRITSAQFAAYERRYRRQGSRRNPRL